MRGWAIAAVAVAASVTFVSLENTRADRVANYVNIANALLADRGTWDQAETFYYRALGESPRSPAAHFGMGTLLTQKRQPKEALGHYQTAVEGWPENVDLRLNYALALVDAGDHPGALTQLDAAATLRASDPTAHLLAGKVLLTTGRYEEARQRFERVLALEPGDEDARASLAQTDRLLARAP
jgi:tetratricopeptide (TPR) repeat protein